MTSAQQLFSMGFGAVVAIAGLVLLFIRKETGRNRIKVLGQEFEISTPALVVFLGGCGVFILPFFLEFRPASSAAVDEPVAMSPAPAPSRIADPASTLLPPDPAVSPGRSAAATGSDGAREIEPNSEFLNATSIAVGTAIEGNIANSEDEEYFVFRTGPADGGEFLFAYRNLGTRVSPMIRIYDATKQQVAREYRTSYGADLEVPFSLQPNSTYYLSVHAFWYQDSRSSSDYRIEISRVG